MSQKLRVVWILVNCERRTNAGLQRQFYDIAAKVDAPIVKRRIVENLRFAQSEPGERLQLFARRHYFMPANLPRPRIFILAMLPYCFIMRRMSAYCLST